MTGSGTGVDTPPHPRGGCATCHHFGEWCAWIDNGRETPYRVIGGNVWCTLHAAVIGLPRLGCDRWEREPGTDDALT